MGMKRFSLLRNLQKKVLHLAKASEKYAKNSLKNPKIKRNTKKFCKIP
jgi:hypothetical protein